MMLAAGSVVINEISYNPDVKTEPVEFVELTNPGTTPVDLSGAAFTSGVAYTFPAGTTLPAGGYLVVAANPAAVQAKFGLAGALGPWAGKLSNSGEDLVVKDSLGTTLDDVDYNAGFPWPTIGDSPGPGWSIELINPNFDNSLGGNWRAFNAAIPTPVTLIPSGSKWDYRKGTAEASSPIGYWRGLDYAEDSAWQRNATAPIGYDTTGTPVMGTTLSDMNGNYTTVYLRRTFYVPDPGAALGLSLEALYDDGFNVYVNGHLAQTVNTAGDNQAFSALASSTRESNTYQSFSINPTFLLPGSNVIAVQLLNNVKSGSPDAFFDARLIETTGKSGPTPGAPNASLAANAPPVMRQVSNVPQMPAANHPVTITAKVTDPDGVASVSLSYQLVDAGNYIAKEDAAYADPANWTTLAMHDDGLNGDVLANDSVFTAVLPASVQVNRRLVRYRITSTDLIGATVTGPYPDDPVPNFAYYVYNGTPSYSAALQPGASGTAGQVVTYPASALDAVPVLQIITKQLDHDNAQHIPGATTASYGGSEFPWSGTLVSNGVVYDDIHYRARGGVWRYAMGKNVWKINFQNGHDFQPYYADGTPYPTQWKKLNLRADIQQGDIGDRGEQGLFETLGYQMYNLAGVPAERTIPMTLRIVESPTETGATQFNTDFQGLYLAVEEPDGRFLDSHGLPDGNVYKMKSGSGPGGGALHNQGPTQPSDNSDLLAFTTALAANPTDQWIRDNVDLDEFYSFQAVTEMIHNWDIGFGKNYNYYHNPDTNKWEIIPWDLDLTFYVNYQPNNGDLVPLTNAILSRPAFQIEYRNRVRELRDLLFNSEQVGAMADAYANLVNPPGGGPTLVGADAAMWNYNPIVTSSFVNSTKAGAGRFYQNGQPTKDFPGMVSRLKLWSATRFSILDSAVLTPADEAAAPQKPSASYTGPAGFPSNQLTFSTSAFAAGSGGGTFAAIQWRLADVTTLPGGSQPYEVNAAWDSGPLAAFSPTFTVPGSAVIPGQTYRVRVRMQDSNGRWSHWSNVAAGATQFRAAAPASAVGRSLRVTELNYDPTKPAGSPYNNDDFEFIELKNFGSQTINLSGVQFTDGITYLFGDVSLAPGQAGVLVKNLPAFQSRYGTTGILILGDYLSTGQSFSNGGEHVEIVDPFNLTIADFTYDSLWYPATHAGGASLEVIDPVISPDLNLAANWRASTAVNGTPGVESSITLPSPGNPTAMAVSTTQINLSWSDNASAEQGYRIYRADGSGGAFVQVADLPANSTAYADNNGGAGLSPATRYTYRVQAYAAAGGGFSGYVEMGTTTLPPAPTGLIASGGGGAITLIWNTIAGATSYNVYRASSPGGEGPTPLAAGLISPSYVDTTVTNGQTWYYVATAVTIDSGESVRSSEASAALALAGTIIGTDGSWNNAGNTKDKAMDGDLTTFFDAPDPGTGDWVGLDLGVPKIITQVMYAPRSGFAGRMNGGKFQGANSPDFSDAVTLYTITATPPTGYSPQAVNNPTPFRYVRYLGPDPSWGNVAEVQFFGYAPASASISGRWVFYNGSSFDGGDPGASPADDAAIATDKSALLPGQTATSANYTSYVRGINGVMIDILGLPDAGSLSISDFAFASGTAPDPSTWPAAPLPTSLNVRLGAGAGGADRVTLLWDDNAIQNAWLRVTAKAGAGTGLGSPDVFYFGNLIGDGNGSGSVTVADVALTKSVQGQVAAITASADFNRNGQITVADVAIAKAYQGNAIPMLIAPAAPAPAAAPATAPLALTLSAATAPAPTHSAAPRRQPARVTRFLPYPFSTSSTSHALPARKGKRVFDE